MSSKLPRDTNKGEYHEPLADFRRMMNDFFLKPPVKGFLQSIDEFFQMPFSTFPVQVKELQDEQIITAELPGVKKEQVNIDVLDSSIMITVKNIEIITEENESKNIYKKSQSMQQMSRNIYLGYPIDERKVKASYQNGLLKIRVPKPQGKKINILDET